jgi:hypothetical protein
MNVPLIAAVPETKCRRFIIVMVILEMGLESTIAHRAEFFTQTRSQVNQKWTARIRPHSLTDTLVQLTLFVEMTVSGNLLTWLGSSYISEQGIWPEKIHPGTYLAILAMASALMQGVVPLRNLRRMVRGAPELALCTTALSACILYALLLTGTGGLITLIDTFLPAALLACALIGTPLPALARLRRLLCGLFLLNAILALIEAGIHYHFIPIAGDIPELPSEFRPTGLYDHPLTAATATMVGMYVQPNPLRTPILSGIYQFILLMALMAFGGRVALALTCLAWGVLFARSVWKPALQRRMPTRQLLVAAALICTLAGATFCIGQAGIGERILLHAYWDPSAQSRVNEFVVLDKLDTNQLIFGCRRGDLLALIEPMRLTYGVDVIENFWLLIFCTLGCLGFPLFLAGFCALLVFLWRRTGLHGHLMLITFLGAVSSSNSLGRKSTLLVTLVGCMAVCADSSVTSWRFLQMKRRFGGTV